MHKLPTSAAELVEQLHAENPHRCPRIEQSERDIWMQAGRRQLIDELLIAAQQSRVKLNLNAPLQEQEEGD